MKSFLFIFLILLTLSACSSSDVPANNAIVTVKAFNKVVEACDTSGGLQAITSTLPLYLKEGESATDLANNSKYSLLSDIAKADFEIKLSCEGSNCKPRLPDKLILEAKCSNGSDVKVSLMKGQL